MPREVDPEMLKNPRKAVGFDKKNPRNFVGCQEI